MKKCYEIPVPKKRTPRRSCSFLLVTTRNFTPGNSTSYFDLQATAFLQPHCFGFFWNSQIYRDPCTLMSRELNVAAELLTNFELLKGVSTFLLFCEKRQLTYKYLKKSRVVSVESSYYS